jgi:hypothetical protein
LLTDGSLSPNSGVKADTAAQSGSSRGDAITSGAVDNLARPGTKRLEILRDAMPHIRCIAIFFDPNTDPIYMRVSEATPF